MDFRISFSRNEWLSFIKQRSTCGTYGLGTRDFLSSIPWIIVENYMLYLILCNSQDNLPFFLLSPACFLWAVICSQPAGHILMTSFHIAPHVFVNCSHPVLLFSFYICVCVCVICMYTCEDILQELSLWHCLLNFEAICLVWWKQIWLEIESNA